MKENWDKAFGQVIAYEGGYVNHPKDPGGPTNRGITQATLGRYLGRAATIDEVKALTKESVKPIYRRYFWDALRCDELPGGVDLAVYDFGVNSGTGRAARYLQSVVGVHQDGRIGPATVAAVNKYSAEEVVKRLVAKRRGFLMGLKMWRTFGKGWNRRLVSVQTASLAMAPPSTGTAYAGLSRDIPPDDPVADVVEVSASERESNQVIGDTAAQAQLEAEQNPGIGGLWGCKNILASKTVWANIIGLASIGLSIAGIQTGTIDVNGLAEAASQLIAAGSFIASTLFRIYAKYQLTTSVRARA